MSSVQVLLADARWYLLENIPFRWSELKLLLTAPDYCPQLCFIQQRILRLIARYSFVLILAFRQARRHARYTEVNDSYLSVIVKTTLSLSMWANAAEMLMTLTPPKIKSLKIRRIILNVSALLSPWGE